MSREVTDTPLMIWRFREKNSNCSTGLFTCSFVRKQFASSWKPDIRRGKVRSTLSRWKGIYLFTGLQWIFLSLWDFQIRR